MNFTTIKLFDFKKNVLSRHILFFISLNLISHVHSFCQIDKVLNDWNSDASLKHASIGYCVLNTADESVVAEHNAHQFLIPASTLKVITTGAALGILGNNYKFTTKIYHTGNFDQKTGVIHGDLIIYGHGDPSLQSEYFTKDTTQITDKWAKILVDKGVKEVKGKIIGDATYFDRSIPSNWIWADISNYFGVVPCALSYADNKFKIIYCTKESGCKADVVKTIPAYLNNTVTINSNVIAKGNDDEAYVQGDPFSFIKEVNGKIPPKKANYDVEAALPDPALLCAEMLFTSLTRSGIKCDIHKIESVYKNNDTIIPKRALLHTHFSPSLDKLIFFTNLRSNNHYCETLLRAIGKGSLSNGLDLVKKYWKDKGLNTDELFMTDGSGLSRADNITTHFQAAALTKIKKDSVNYKYFINSLPVAGKSGSMHSLGKGNFIENNMKAKTGYINRARGYCGYVTSKSGKELAFSVLFNNYNCTAKEAKLKLEKFLIALAEL
ncbi:MAG: D-alanyl-D-alanine carboxypeptidase/D-alanyl-D-alanine-endopeptidase [Sphingobacteriaceae bacterium]|nr:D-alanyl-D-alanine carboxypeptidase/D-alanyl-D-alanine-endopeptidase [Sphingobacteriaceae bacterium]